MNANHYPSLELCKKLKEIGFPNKTMLSWCDFSMNRAEGVNPKITDVELGTPRREDKFIAVCPSVMEMLDVIPHEIHIKEPKHTRWLHIGKDTVSYMETAGTKYPNGFMFMDSVLPNAIAEMILWLHENKHLTFQNGN